MGLGESRLGYDRSSAKYNLAVEALGGYAQTDKYISRLEGLKKSPKDEHLERLPYKNFP